MRHLKHFIVVFALAFGLMAGAAHADAVKNTVDAAKAVGKVGERWDGYVEAIKPADANLKAAIDAMNARRKAIYAEAAVKTNATVEQAGVVFAENIIEKLPPGYYYKPNGGSWTKK